MTTPAICRALSARIQAGDKTVTNAEIALALGWTEIEPSPGSIIHLRGRDPNSSGGFRTIPLYLTRVDATRADWPEGWWITNMFQHTNGRWGMEACSDDASVSPEAPTEPATRAALLLEIRAVELEAMG